MRIPEWKRAELDRAIIVLVHELVGLERANRFPLSASNRKRVRDDAAAINHLLKFAEYAITELGITASDGSLPASR